MSIGDIVAADLGSKAPDMSIVSDLRAAMIRRAPDHRAFGWHPSGLFEMCPRLEVLQQLVPNERDDEAILPEKPDLRTQMIFDVGTALHSWWQEQYLGPIGHLKGNWRCRSCGIILHDQFMPPHPHKCSIDESSEPIDLVTSVPIRIGGNRYWAFDEVPVRSDEWGIVGNSDGIYVLGHNTLAEEEIVLDIKTAGKSFWESERPYPANIFQLNIYMWLLKKKRGILLYVDKGGLSQHELACKEVVVNYNDSHRKDACEKIGSYRLAITSKKLPSRMATCELRPNSGKAKCCKMRSVCLSDKKSDEIERSWGLVVFK